MYFNWKVLLFVALIGYGAYQHFSQRPVVYGPGVMVATQPLQSSTNAGSFHLNGYVITPLKSFEITARVLSSKRYTFDGVADLSPVDLVLGWGRMSDEAVLKDIDISQMGRFYYWRVDEFPIPRQEIERSSANMHMVPANDAINKILKSIKSGQIISIEGALIKAKGENGRYWKSSLTRNDTGGGACEVVYVKKVTIL